VMMVDGRERAVSGSARSKTAWNIELQRGVR
jgi:hypothetical protein